MSSSMVLLFALGIGFVAGLRAMTAPAVVGVAAHFGWINLSGTPLSFMESKWAAILFVLAALFEYVNDLLPKTPPRTAPGPLIARVVLGALCGACLAVAAAAGAIIGALLGAVGAIIGAFAGYKARVGLVKALKVPDFVVAIPEDLIAIALAVLFAKRG